MCFSELDDPERPSTSTIPAARSKNGRAHTLPVMPTMVSIITSVPRLATRDQLFGKRCTVSPLGEVKDALDERSGVVGWTVHDIRIRSPPVWPTSACSHTSSNKF